MPSQTFVDDKHEDRLTPKQVHQAARVYLAVIVTTVLGIIAVLVLTGYWLERSSGPSAINVSEGRARIIFSVERTFTVLPQQCVRANWDIDQVESISLNNKGVIGKDQTCVNGSISLKVNLQDGTSRQYDIHINVLPFSPEIWLAAGITLVSLVCNVYAVSLRRQILRRPITYSQFAEQIRTLKTTIRDFCFFSFLLSIASLPLVFLRNPSYVQNSTFMWGLLIAWLDTVVLWSVVSRTDSANQLGAKPPSKTVSFGKSFFISASLLLLCVVGFYLPMRQHYWVGLDEVINLQAKDSIWFPFYDHYANRPLATLTTFISLNLTPWRLDGILWGTAAIRLMTGLLIFGIVRILLRRSYVPALIAAALFIISPAEEWRFAAVLLEPYHAVLFFIVLAMWLYLLSYRYTQRWLLCAACVILAIAQLHYETVDAVALLGVALIFLEGRRKHLLTWSFAWLGTWALLVFRLMLFLSTGGSYQTANYIIPASSLHVNVASNLVQLASAHFSYFESLPSLPQYSIQIIVAILVIFPLLWLSMRQAVLPRPKQQLLGIVVALGALLLAIAPGAIAIIPQVPLPRENPRLRWQFLADPAYAVIWAFSITLLTTLLPRRWKNRWMLSATCFLVALGVAGAFKLQSQRGIVNPNVDFEKISKAFVQARKLMPPLTRDSAIFFATDENDPTSFGADYNLKALSCVMFGVPGFQGTYSPQQGWKVRTLLFDMPSTQHPNYDFDEVNTIFTDLEGNVTLINPPIPSKQVDPSSHDTLERGCSAARLVNSIDQPLPYLELR